jgi:hypothetical protein
MTPNRARERDATRRDAARASVHGGPDESQDGLEKTEIPAGHRWPVAGGVVWSAKVSKGPGRIRRQVPKKSWHIGGWWPDHEPQMAAFPGNAFPTADKAKRFVQDLADAHARAANRVANREIGDVVMAAEQYYEAQQDELDLMKEGTSQELSAARKRTKKAKEVLENMTGANRELLGAMGGGTLGAGLGALTGNPLVAAIGALVGSVVLSFVARPSPLSFAPAPRSRRDEGRLVPFQRPAYAANRGRRKSVKA